MKKIGKKMNLSTQTLEAYDGIGVCGCISCSCSHCYLYYEVDINEGGSVRNSTNSHFGPRP